jgi:ribosomal protein S18 acetylase RimI-like enzyme
MAVNMTMRSESQIVPLQKDQIGPAAELAAAAFQEDPFLAYLFPDPARRVRLAHRLCGVGIRGGCLYGHSRTTPDLEGLAIWFEPGQGAASPLRMLRAGILGTLVRLRFAESGRLIRLNHYAEHLRERLVPRPHVHLFLLAVHPERRGRGLGAALLRSVLDEADARGLPCYLETLNPINPAFYQRFGFRIAHEGPIPGDGPTVWGMVREPSTGPSRPGSA